MANILIGDITPKNQYTASANQTVFAYSFPIFADADIKVYVGSTLKTLSTHYSVSGALSANGGNVTLGTGASNGDIVTIYRDMAVSRTSDYQSNSYFLAETLNDDLDKVVLMAQQVEEQVNNDTIKVHKYDVAADLTLPLVAARKGTVLGFHATTGAPEAGPTIANVNSLSAITANINTVAGIASNVTTVAGISANTSTVAGISAAVSTVAGISSAVSAVNSNASNINAVAADASDIGAVAGKATEIGRLGTSDAIADLALLATNAVVADLAILGTNDVVADMAILATSDVVTDMNVLATSDVVTDMNLLATSTVVGNMNLLGTAAVVEDMGILATSAIVADLALLATSDVIADMALLATSDVISDMNALATSDIISDLNTLATSDIVTDMNLLATSANVSAMGTLGTSANVTAMSTVSGAIANVNTTASNIAGVNSFAARYRVASSAPSSDLDEGDLYFNTNDNNLYHYNGSAWVVITSYSVGAGGLSQQNFTTTLKNKLDNVEASATADQTAAQIKTLLEDGIDSVHYVDDSIDADHLANSINTDIATGVTANTTANAALAKAGGTMTGDLNFGDNDVIQMGAGNDLRIYHDGSNSYIDDADVGKLHIRSNEILLQKYTGETLLQATADGAVSLNHDNSVKFATTAAGATVTGNLAVTGTVDGIDIQTLNTTAAAALAKAGGTMTGDLILNDNVKLEVGSASGGDLQIYHDGSNSYISEAGTGSLLISADGAIQFKKYNTSELMARFDADGASTLYHNGTKKLETTSAGVTAQGRLEIQVANDANTHLLQRMGSDSSTYGYVDFELVTPNSSATNLPRLDMQIGNANILSLCRGGNVGIGLTNPDTTLNVAGNIRAEANSTPLIQLKRTGNAAGNGYIECLGSDNSVDYKIAFGQTAGTMSFSTATSNALTIDGSGEMLKGPFAANGSSTGTKIINGELHSSYNGTAPRKQIYIYNPNGEVGSISSSFTSCVFATSSDYRLKENVVYDWDATTRLKQLKPARFNFISHAERTVDGFLAHEAATVVPEAVTGLKDAMKDEVLYVEGDILPNGKSIGDVKEASVPDMQGIDQSKLVPLLVKTIQELEARITALES